MVGRLRVVGALGISLLAAACGKDANKATSTPVNEPDARPVELSPVLPIAQGTCPAMVEGDQQFLGKNVLLHVPPEGAPTGGPLVIYWHGTGSGTFECAAALGTTLGEITAQGGVVACMDGGQSVGEGTYTGPFEWYEGDFDVADEVVACAMDRFQLDPRRIHTLGMSAGGLQTSAMVLRRSYLASAVSLSGGCGDCPEPPDPENKIPMLLFHGSYEADQVIIHFIETSHLMENTLLERGQFTVDCNHNQGHIIPPEAPSMWRFLADHPYRVTPEPYENGLPDGFPAYCQIVKEAWPPTMP